MKKMTLEEFREEAIKRFGPDPKDWIMVCPKCNTPQTYHDFARTGLDNEAIEGQLGYSCIGRHDKSMGCDWTLGGMFQIHTLVVLAKGEEWPRFELAEAGEKIKETTDEEKILLLETRLSWAIDELLRQPKYRDCSRHGIRTMIEREAKA